VKYFELTENIYIGDHHFNKKEINVGIDGCFDQYCTKSKYEFWKVKMSYIICKCIPQLKIH
jgi:hypothetical protein